MEENIMPLLTRQCRPG